MTEVQARAERCDSDIPALPPSNAGPATVVGEDQVGKPAPDACTSCPYRRDVPSGIWSEDEYAKLEKYDRPTGEQPVSVFLCHQNDIDSDAARMCAGWAACHAQRARTVDGVGLLALRIALITGRISPATYDAATNHSTRSELFESGTTAAEHGRTDIAAPSPAAQAMIAKITRRRGDLH